MMTIIGFFMKLPSTESAKATQPKSQSQKVVKPGFEPRNSDCRNHPYLHTGPLILKIE